MSFDLVPDENATTMLRASRSSSLAPEPGIWTGFVPGGGSMVMKGFAETARAVDLLGALGPMAEDRVTGGTAATDTYFKEHDEVFNRAVDYWTPGPGEVGTAGRVVGSLIPTLAQVAVSPGLAINTATQGTAEDLVRQGVDANKAASAGIVQGTGLGLGIYLPIFGKSWMMRALVAGAGSNVAQGVASRAATAKILEGTEAAKQYDPWNAENIVLDTLMGVGFGTLAHMGAKDAEAIKRARDAMTESDKAALLAANQARHLEDTTAPGQPLSDVDRTIHASAMRKAVDDVLQGRPAEVSQIISEARFAPDDARAAAQAEIAQAVSEESQRVVQEAIAKEARAAEASETPGFLRTADQMLALRKEERPDYAPELERAVAIAKKPGFQRSADEKVTLDTFLRGRGAEVLLREIPDLPRPAVEAPKAEAPAAPAKPETVAEPADPVIAEARQRVAENPDLAMVGDDGKPVKVADMLDAVDRESAKSRELEGLLPAAAQCFMGML